MLTVERFLLEWLEHMRHHVRPLTDAGYESNVRLHLIPRIGSKMLSRLTVRDVRLMVGGLRSVEMSPRMVQWIHASLRTTGPTSISTARPCACVAGCAGSGCTTFDTAA